MVELMIPMRVKLKPGGGGGGGKLGCATYR